jgi:hypothetical protein
MGIGHNEERKTLITQTNKYGNNKLERRKREWQGDFIHWP